VAGHGAEGINAPRAETISPGKGIELVPKLKFWNSFTVKKFFDKYFYVVLY
jgi:hypothetical protein